MLDNSDPFKKVIQNPHTSNDPMVRAIAKLKISKSNSFNEKVIVHTKTLKVENLIGVSDGEQINTQKDKYLEGLKLEKLRGKSWHELDKTGELETLFKLDLNSFKMKFKEVFNAEWTK